MTPLDMTRLQAVRVGALVLVLALAVPIVWLLALSEGASPPVDSSSDAVAAATAMPEPADASPQTAEGGRERIAPIRVAPFRDRDPVVTERISVRGVVFAEGTRPPRPLGGVRVCLKEDSADKEHAVTETKADGTWLLEVDRPVEEPAAWDRMPSTLRVWAEKEGWISEERSVQSLATPHGAYSDRAYKLYLSAPIDIAGTVLDAATGEPLEGAQIVQQGHDPSIAFARASTDATGAFKARVADGLMGFLNVEAVGHLGVQVAWTKATLPGNLIIRLPQPQQIPQLNGTVTGPDGAPCADAPVMLRIEPPLAEPTEEEQLLRQHLAYQESRSLKRECLTDRQGKFSAVLPAFGKWAVVSRVGEMTASTVIEVREVRSYTTELALQSRSVRVHGSVKAKSDGRAISGAKITIRGNMVLSSSNLVSDSAGEFRTAPMVYAPGAEFRCVVHAPPYPDKEVTVKPPQDGGELRVLIELDEPCGVRGIVIDGEGQRAAGVTVRATGGGISAEGVTDERGCFVIARFPSGIGVRVAASAEGRGASPEKGMALNLPGEIKDVGTLVLRKH